MPVHAIAPVYDRDSRVLVLGSFPSVKSREEGFFYGHKMNRFWKVLAAVFEREEPKTVEEKKNLLLSSKVALWDVIASCEIEGSADATIRNVVPNDIARIINETKISLIAVNGKTAMRYYEKYLAASINITVICLPSTSAANAAWSLPRLITAWKQIRFSEEDNRNP